MKTIVEVNTIELEYSFRPFFSVNYHLCNKISA
jgi:hypothetical protein